MTAKTGSPKIQPRLRFGLYVVTIWLLLLAAFVLLALTVGWAWSWLTVVAGFVAMMLMLARMLFSPRP